jgi:hypothetical protein
MPKEDKELNIQDYFRKYSSDKESHNIDRDISEVLRAVNLKAPLDKIVDAFSG